MRRREDRAMLARIGVAGAIAANVMLAALALYSGQFGGMDGPYERFFRWVSLLLTTPALFGPGRVFFAGAWASLKTRTLHMDLPIAIALAVGWAQGLANTITDSGPIYFDGLATLIFALLAGRFLQQRGQRAATDSAELLYSLSPLTARVVEGEVTREVPAQALLPGMMLEVRAGESFAADGTVHVGTLEGRRRVAHRRVEARLRSTSAIVCTPGRRTCRRPLRVRVDAAGEQSRLAKTSAAGGGQRAPARAGRAARESTGGMVRRGGAADRRGYGALLVSTKSNSRDRQRDRAARRHVPVRARARDAARRERGHWPRGANRDPHQGWRRDRAAGGAGHAAARQDRNDHRVTCGARGVGRAGVGQAARARAGAGVVASDRGRFPSRVRG